MESDSSHDNRESQIARRIGSLIDRGSSAGASSDDIDIAECLLVLQEIWPEKITRDGASHGVPGDGNGQCQVEGPSPSFPRRLGRFEIRRLLGHGGFGIVLLAYDETLDREVALKIPRPEFLFSKEMRSRFVREAKAAALLDHPGIVPVYDAGEIGPIWYIAAGYVKGPSLSQWLHDHPARRSARTSGAVVMALAEVVQHAHSRGILHRDLKPSNVLLEPIEAQSAGKFPFAPKLSDFGLAKRLESGDQETVSGMLLGTPRYMAPEQAGNREKEIGIQTDVYGLGAILHELLAGEPPFVADSNEAVLTRIQNEEVSPTRLRQSKVPKDLETICLKCLEREPARRYQTAGELANDLHHYLADEPVSARPIGRASRLMRWARRRPVIAGLTLSLIVSLTGGIVFGAWQWMRAEEHLRESLAATSRAEQNLAQAEQSLLDLAWIVEESSLWDQKSSQFRDAVQEKLKRYHESIARQEGTQSGQSAIMAAIYSFAARNAALAGETDVADKNFRRALDAWQEAASDQPTKAEYRRAWSLCLLHFSELITDVSVQNGEDPRSVLQPFYENIGRDPRYGPLVLSDYASLMLDHGMRLFRTDRKGAHDTLKVGLIAAHVLCDTSPLDPSARFLTVKLWQNRGVVEGAMRDYSSADKSLGEAINILENLRADDAANTDYMADLAQANFERGVFADRHNDKQRAIESMARSLALSDLLAKTSGADPPNRLRRAVSLRSLGRNLGTQNRAEESRRAFVEYGEALGEIDRRHEQIPPEELRFWGGVCHQLGIELKDGGDLPAALDSFLKGAKAFERARDLAVKFSSIDSLHQGECYFLAAILQRSDQKDEAARNLDKCLAMLKTYIESPNPDQHLKRLHQKVAATLTQMNSE